MAPSEKKDVTVFPTQIAMLQLVSYVGEDGLQIKVFREDEKLGYEGKSPSGHIWWDIYIYIYIYIYYLKTKDLGTKS